MNFNQKLNVFSKNYTSQHGEDGILEYILSKLPPSLPQICCEFGAWDGKHLSNTFTLWNQKGWQAILVESDGKRVKDFKKQYNSFSNVKIFEKLLKSEGEDSLDQLFLDQNFPKDIGVLSIDIDSVDYYIWKGINKINPWVVIIEHNQTIPGFIDYVDPEGSIFLRASAKALDKLGVEKGYKLICCTLTNCIFIKNEFFNNKYFPDFPVEGLFDYSHCKPFFMLPSDPQGGDYQGFHAYYGEDGLYVKLLRYYFFVKSFLKGKKVFYPKKNMRKYLRDKNIYI